MWERRIALFTAFLTFCLLIAGGLVHTTGSGLACPDWPLCNGEFFPKMTGGVEFEHSHRLIAAAVSILTLLLTVFLWRKRSELRYLSVFAFFLVLFQAGLGALTVIYKLPTMIKTAHLATSMIFFSTLLVMAFRLHENHFLTAQNSRESKQSFHLIQPLITCTLLAVYAQIVLGALVRHTGAGGVCPTIPLCEDSIWPVYAHGSIKLHMAHRLGALLVSALVFLSAFLIYKNAKTLALTSRLRGGLCTLSVLAPLLVVMQVVLGILSVSTDLAQVPVTLHLAFGALLLACYVLLWISLKRLTCGETFTPGFMSDLVSLTKARLSSFVLIVTAVSYALAPHTQGAWKQGCFLIFGMTLLVAGAAFLNCYFERDVDIHMERTRDRPLPSGRMQAKWVLYCGVLLALISIPLLTIYVNPLTAFLGAVAFVLYTLVYTPLKTMTSLSALIGAIPGALPPLIGWTAAKGEIDSIGITLFFILFFWQLPHFFAIAIYRKAEYKNAGLQVMPLAEGELMTRKLMLRYSAMLIPVSLFLVPLGVAGKLYFYVALTLGLIYFLFTCYGLRPLSGALWARRVFLYSLIYLPLLFVTLLLDSRL